MAGIAVSMIPNIGAPRLRGLVAAVLGASLVASGALGCASVRRLDDGPGMITEAPPSRGAASPDTVPPGPEVSASAAASVSTASPSASSAPSTAPSTPSASAEAPSSDGAGKPVKVTVGDPKFEGGEVPKAKAALDRMAKTIKKCVNDNGGLTADKGVIELQFLVRAQGIAEGVDLQNVKGIGAAAKKCVRDAFKKKTIGPPSSDPVGVTIKIELEPA